MGLSRSRQARRTRFSVVVRHDPASAVAAAEQLLAGGGSTVFQSSGWVEAFTRTIATARGCTFFQVEVRESVTGRLAMLLPLLLRERNGLRLIEFPDFGLADYVAPVIAEGFNPGRRAMNRIWAQVRDVLPRADLIRFVKQPAFLAGRANPLIKLGGTERGDQTAWGVDLAPAGSVWRDAFLCDKRRADVDARWRKLNKRGVVTFKTASTDEEADKFFAAMVEQRAARFRTLNFANALDKPEIRAFYRSLLRPDDPASPAVIQALLIDGQVIATGYGLVGNGAFHMIFPTFQADTWRNYSPGLHLFRKSMEWSAQQGLGYYDFTVGAEGFKRDFGAQPQPLFERYEALSYTGLLPVSYVALRRFIKTRPQLASFLCAMKSKLTFGGR